MNTNDDADRLMNIAVNEDMLKTLEATYNQTLSDLNGVSKEDILHAFECNRMTLKEKDETLSAISMLETGVARYPKLIRHCKAEIFHLREKERSQLPSERQANERACFYYSIIMSISSEVLRTYKIQSGWNVPSTILGMCTFLIAGVCNDSAASMLMWPIYHDSFLKLASKKQLDEMAYYVQTSYSEIRNIGIKAQETKSDYMTKLIDDIVQYLITTLRLDDSADSIGYIKDCVIEFIELASNKKIT